MGRDAFFPSSLAEALEIRGSARARPVAGGTDLMVGHRRHAPLPVVLDAPPLFLGHLPELRAVALDGAELVLGAAVTLRELQDHPGCPPGAREVLRWFASPAVRNAATVGGNICNASPAGDLLPWLVACDAVVVLERAGARRELPVAEFVTGPGRTALGEDELLTSVRVPAAGALPGGGRPEPEGRHGFWYYRKVAPRRSNALSKLSVYAQAACDGAGALVSLRLAVGAVAPTVVRSLTAEQALAGRTSRSLRGAVPGALAAYERLIVPIDDQRSTAGYRKRTALALIRHLLEVQLPDYLEQP